MPFCLYKNKKTKPTKGRGLGRGVVGLTFQKNQFMINQYLQFNVKSFGVSIQFNIYVLSYIGRYNITIEYTQEKKCK